MFSAFTSAVSSSCSSQSSSTTRSSKEGVYNNSKLLQRSILSFVLISSILVYMAWNRLSITSTISTSTSLKPTAKQASLLPLGKDWPVNTLSSDSFARHIGIPLDKPALTDSKKYGVFILITTTNPMFKCSTCNEVEKLYTHLSSLVSATTRLKEKVHFSKIDIQPGDKEFLMNIRIGQLPSLLFVPSTEPFQRDPSEYVKNIRMFDFKKEGKMEHNMAGFFIGVAPVIRNDLHEGLVGKNDEKQKSNNLPTKNTLFYAVIGLIITFGTLASIIIIGGKESPKNALKTIIFNPLIPSIVTSFLCLYFCSGSIWTKIRGGPSVSRGPDGIMVWVAAGNQNQFSQEPRAIMILRVCSFISMFVISFVGPNIENTALRRCVLILMISLFTISISSEIAIFRMKLPSYPIKLLF